MDDSLDDIYDEINQLQIIAAGSRSRPKPVAYHHAPTYPDANQIVVVEGQPPGAIENPSSYGNVGNTMDAVVIPEEVDLEYDKQGNAHIHKRQGGGGINADIISIPHKGAGQKFPEDTIDAFIPLGGNHSFQVETPQPKVEVVGPMLPHQCGPTNCGTHPLQHGHARPSELPPPIMGPNGQVLVPTGRYKVQRVVKKPKRKNKTMFEQIFS